MTSGRLAGIDYGTVRIGVAVSDARQTLASPFENYTRRGEKADAEFFRRFVMEESISAFVVGLPVHLSGDESAKSIEARTFGAWLAKTTGLPVEYFDERFTSVEAERYLGAAKMTKKQRKERLDKIAAQILLSAYLESRDRGLNHLQKTRHRLRISRPARRHFVARRRRRGLRRHPQRRTSPAVRTREFSFDRGRRHAA
jgi:putative Holliday junction resolvase